MPAGIPTRQFVVVLQVLPSSGAFIEVPGEEQTKPAEARIGGPKVLKGAEEAVNVLQDLGRREWRVDGVAVVVSTKRRREERVRCMVEWDFW